MTPGTILFHKDFKFSDGATKDKYLVVLGNIDSGVVLAAKTTSKGHRYRIDFGCQSGSYFPAFYLPRGSCCLPLCTWICLDEFYELKADILTRDMVSGQVYKHGELIASLARDLQFCAKGSDDISAHQEVMIDGSLAAV
ncbi:hypothetical protein [Pseudomonas syringae]|uniref:hypothetical protein n=1 Tax=Pseudomonas syringae TaxID=317 RepID=UPI00073F386B|nr:hypothetical protein [Pseudomonas syringae]NAT15842.1 hypothetical protein [Pseudomonas syringae pv. actinidifoliorum]NAT60116.1 hypothetical protein [Pseudomonas syringae pv. actinidifoliorum]